MMSKRNKLYDITAGNKGLFFVGKPQSTLPLGRRYSGGGFTGLQPMQGVGFGNPDFTSQIDTGAINQSMMGTQLQGLDFSLGQPKNTLLGNLGNYLKDGFKSGAMNGAAAQVGGMAGNLIGGGMTSGAGNALSAVGDVASIVPGPWGAAIGAGAKVLGGIANALFGEKVDQEKLQAANAGTSYLANFNSTANNFDEVRGPQTQAAVQDAYSGGLFNTSADRKNAELRRRRRLAQEQADRSVVNNVGNIASDQMNRALANYAAFGGELGTNGTDFTNGLLYIDEGGSHESNPLDGVPMGVDENGIPNLVEEGETVFNDYVFSKRMKVPQKMYHQLGLGGAIKSRQKKRNKGITFADASKILAKESEQRPNDPISIAGLKDSLGRLAEVQEAERMRLRMRELANSPATQPEAEGLMAQGGPLGRMYVGNGDEPNVLNLADRDQRSWWTRALGNNGVSRFMNNASAFVSDPIGYVAGDELEAAVDRIANYTEPQLEKFFNTELGQRVAQYIVDSESEENPDLQEAGAGSGIGQKAAKLGRRFGKPISRAARKAVTKSVGKGKVRLTTGPTRPNPGTSLAPIGPRSVVPTGTTSVVPQGATGLAVRGATGIAPTGPTSMILRGANPGLVPYAGGVGGAGSSWLPWAGAALGAGAIGARVANRDEDNSRAWPDSPTGVSYWGDNEGQNRIPDRIWPEDGSPRWLHSMNDVLLDYRNPYRAAAVGGDPVLQSMRGWKPISAPLTAEEAAARAVNSNAAATATERTATTRGGSGATGGGAAVRRATPAATSVTPVREAAAPAERVGVAPAVSGVTPTSGVTATVERGVGADPYGPASYTPLGERPEEFLSRLRKTNNGDPSGLGKAVVNGEVVRDDTPKPYATWMRYAPAVGAGVFALTDALGLTNNPDYTYANKLEAAANAAGYAPSIQADPIGDYMTYRPMDIWYEQNRMNAGARAADRAVLNSGASQGARIAGLVANNYNDQLASGDLYRRALEYNDAQRERVADFNRRTNMYNSQMGLEAAMANARYRQGAASAQLSGLAQAAALRDSIDQRVGASRSANITNFLNSLGNIGRENFIFNQINGSAAARNGYWIDRNGKIHHIDSGD